MKKALLILLLLLCTSCNKVTTVVPNPYPIKYEIVYLVGESTSYSHIFYGDETAHYDVVALKGFNVIIIWRNTSNAAYAYKTKESIKVLSFNKLN